MTHLFYRLNLARMRRGGQMAIILMSTTIQDILGVTGTQNVWLNITGTQTVDNVGAEANTYLPLLDAVTDGKILTSRFIWEIDLPGGLKDAPVADSTISRGLLQGWTQATNVRRHPSTLIPAVSRDIIDDATGKFDQANTDYLAWRSHLRGLTGAIKFVSDELYNITGVFRILESQRKHRKRTAELSFEEPA